MRSSGPDLFRRRRSRGTACAIAARIRAHPIRSPRITLPMSSWFVLRRARRAAPRRRYETKASYHVRTKIRVALKFLAWLDTLQLDLANVDQANVDRWLTEGITRAREFRSFLAWARSHRLTRELRVPFPARSQPEAMLDEPDRWQLLERSLQDTAAPLDTRAAAALILLYGLPLIRVRSLTTDHLEQNDDNAPISLSVTTACCCLSRLLGC